MKRIIPSLVLAAVGLGAGSAYAAPVAGLFAPFPDPTLISDNSAEFLINVDGSTSIGGTPTVTPGDILVAIAGFNTIEGTTIGSGTGFSELTAITASKIATASDIDFGPVGPDDSIGSQSIDLWQFTFAALSAADTTYFDWSTGQINLDGTGVADFTFTSALGASNNGLNFALLFEDPANNYTRAGTIQTGLISATDGTARWLLNLDPTNSDFFSAIAPLDTAAFGSIPAATAIDNSNLALDATIAVQNWGSLVVDPNLTGGNGGLSSPTAGSGFPIFDNLDLTVTTVPEPGTLTLFSLGLLGAGSFVRRRSTKRG